MMTAGGAGAGSPPPADSTRATPVFDPQTTPDTNCAGKQTAHSNPFGMAPLPDLDFQIGHAFNAFAVRARYAF